jgi:uncharacterized damage-inducible protein DinB
LGSGWIHIPAIAHPITRPALKSIPTPSSSADNIAMHQEVMALLDRERHALLAAVDGVSEAHRERRPASDRWSVAEILEHLATVEQAVAKLIAIRGREPLPPDMEPPVPLASERLAELRVRDRRIDAPDTLRPAGTLTAAAAAGALDASRAALLAAARAADPVALERRTYHHAVIGRITLRDWLVFVAHHEARHAAQIAEIAAAYAR